MITMSLAKLTGIKNLKSRVAIPQLLCYPYSMKKSNVKASQQKVKRAIKNKKRLADKPKVSSHEAKIERIRQDIIAEHLGNF